MGVAFSLVLTVAALTMIALALPRHHRQAFGRPAPRGRARAFGLAAAALSALAPLPWIAEHGPTMALVAWIFCATPLAGLAVAALFTVLDLRQRPKPD